MNSIVKHIRSDRGAAESKTPAIIFILVLLVIALLAYKFIPVKVRSMKFDGALHEIIQSNLQQYTKRNAQTIIAAIQKKAMECGIPKLIEGKNIIVKELDNQRYSATVKYAEIISIPIYGDYIWPFEFSAVEVK